MHSSYVHITELLARILKRNLFIALILNVIKRNLNYFLIVFCTYFFFFLL